MIMKIMRALWIGVTVFVLAVLLFSGFDGEPSYVGALFILCLQALWFGVKVLWIAVTVFLLVVMLYGFDGQPGSDILLVFMLCLSFPSGLLVLLVHDALYKGLSVWFKVSYLSIVLDWAVFFVLGYLQWFKLLPYLITKLRRLIEKKLQ